jgi:uncharacterized damage-inducible protein DinB
LGFSPGSCFIFLPRPPFLPPADSPKQVPGRTYPYETTLDRIVQHAIYHVGQIAMVLSILRQRFR